MARTGSTPPQENQIPEGVCAPNLFLLEDYRTHLPGKTDRRPQHDGIKCFISRQIHYCRCRAHGLSANIIVHIWDKSPSTSTTTPSGSSNGMSKAPRRRPPDGSPKPGVDALWPNGRPIFSRYSEVGKMTTYH